MDAAFFKRNEVKLLALFMVLLALAAGWLLSSRPGHKIEGDLFAREQAREADPWLVGQSRTHPIAEIRARAVLALGRIGGDIARDRLIEALGDDAPSVRAAAAFGLGLIENAAYVEEPSARVALALRKTLRDKERQVVANAVEALGRMRRSDAANAVARTPAPFVYTLTALVRMDARELIDFTASTLASDDQDVRWAGAVALDRFEAECNERIERSLVNLARDRNAFVRAAAVRGLGKCEPSEAVTEALEKVRSDKDPKVRIEGAVAEARLAGRPLPDWPPPEPRPLADARPEPPEPFNERELQEIARTEGRRLAMRTTIGDFEMSLDYENAPVTAERFYRLAMGGAYDGVPFTARPNAYAQAAPKGVAASIPEPNTQPFLRGSLGMVRYGRDLDTAEFFIAVTPLPFADGEYTNFGRLLSGDDRLDALSPNEKIVGFVQ